MPNSDGALDTVTVTFWDLIAAHRDATGASEAWIMRQAGLDKGTFSAWRARGIPALPRRDQLEALARVLHLDYAGVLEVVLRDVGYAAAPAAEDMDDDLDDLEPETMPDLIYRDRDVQQRAARKEEKP